MDDKELLRIHGYVLSSDSDNSCDSDIEYLYELLKPPPLLIDDSKTEIVTIKGDTPKNNVITIGATPSSISPRVNLLREKASFQVRTPATVKATKLRRSTKVCKKNVITIRALPSNISSQINSLKKNALLQVRRPTTIKASNLRESAKVSKKNKNKMKVDSKKVDSKKVEEKIDVMKPPIKPNKRYPLYSLLKFTYSLLTLKHDKYDRCKCYIQSYFKRPDSFYSYRKSSCLCRTALLKGPLRKKKNNKKPHKTPVSKRGYKKKHRKHKSIFVSKNAAYENYFWHTKTPIRRYFRSHKEKEIENKSLPKISKKKGKGKKKKKHMKMKESVCEVHEISNEKLRGEKKPLKKVNGKKNNCFTETIKETHVKIDKIMPSSVNDYIYDFNLHNYNKVGSKLTFITAKEKQQYELNMKTDENVKKETNVFKEDLLFKDLREKFVGFFHHLDNDAYILYKSSLCSFLKEHKINRFINIMLMTNDWSCKDALTHDDIKTLFFLPLLKNCTKGKISLDIYRRKLKSKSNLKVLKIVRPPPVRRTRTKKKKQKIKDPHKSDAETAVIPCNLEENVRSFFISAQLNNQFVEQTQEIYVKTESISDLPAVDDDEVEKVSKIVSSQLLNNPKNKEETVVITESVSNDLIPVSNTLKESTDLIAYKSDSMHISSTLEETATIPSSIKQEDAQEILSPLPKKLNLNQILRERAKQCTPTAINYFSKNYNVIPTMDDLIVPRNGEETNDDVIEKKQVAPFETEKSNFNPILPGWINLLTPEKLNYYSKNYNLSSECIGIQDNSNKVEECDEKTNEVRKKKKKKSKKKNNCELISEEIDKIMINDEEIQSSSTHTEGVKQEKENPCLENIPLITGEGSTPFETEKSNFNPILTGCAKQLTPEELNCYYKNYNLSSECIGIQDNSNKVEECDEKTNEVPKKKKKKSKKKNNSELISEEIVNNNNTHDTIMINDEEIQSSSTHTEGVKQKEENPCLENIPLITGEGSTPFETEKSNFNPILTEWAKRLTQEELNYYSKNYNLSSECIGIQYNSNKVEECDEKNNEVPKKKKKKSKKKNNCELISEEIDKIMIIDEEIQSSSTHTEGVKQEKENSCLENIPLITGEGSTPFETEKSEKSNINPILTEWANQLTPEEIDYYSKNYNLSCDCIDIQENSNKIEECDEKNNEVTKKKKKKSKKKTNCELTSEETVSNNNNNNTHDKIMINDEEIQSSSTHTQAVKQEKGNLCLENIPLITAEESEAHKETLHETNCDTTDDNKHIVSTAYDTAHQLLDENSSRLPTEKDIANPNLSAFEKFISSFEQLMPSCLFSNEDSDKTKVYKQSQTTICDNGADLYCHTSFTKNEDFILEKPSVSEINSVANNSTGLSAPSKKKKKKNKAMQEVKETINDPLTDTVICNSDDTCEDVCVSSPTPFLFTNPTETEDLFLPVSSINNTLLLPGIYNSYNKAVDLLIVPKKKRKRSKKKISEETVVDEINVIKSACLPVASTSTDNDALQFNSLEFGSKSPKLEMKKEEPNIITPGNINEINSVPLNPTNETVLTEKNVTEVPQNTSKNKYFFDISRDDNNMDLKNIPLELFALHLKDKNSLKNVKKLIESKCSKPEENPPKTSSYSDALKTPKTPEPNKNSSKNTAETNKKSSDGAKPKVVTKTKQETANGALKKTVPDKAKKKSSDCAKSNNSNTNKSVSNNALKNALKIAVLDEAKKKSSVCAKSSNSVSSNSKSKVEANVNINININVTGEASNVVKTKKKRGKKKTSSNPLLDAILRSIK